MASPGAPSTVTVYAVRPEDEKRRRVDAIVGLDEAGLIWEDATYTTPIPFGQFPERLTSTFFRRGARDMDICHHPTCAQDYDAVCGVCRLQVCARHGDNVPSEDDILQQLVRSFPGYNRGRHYMVGVCTRCVTKDRTPATDTEPAQSTLVVRNPENGRILPFVHSFEPKYFPSNTFLELYDALKRSYPSGDVPSHPPPLPLEEVVLRSADSPKPQPTPLLQRVMEEAAGDEEAPK